MYYIPHCVKVPSLLCLSVSHWQIKEMPLPLSVPCNNSSWHRSVTTHLGRSVSVGEKKTPSRELSNIFEWYCNHVHSDGNLISRVSDLPHNKLFPFSGTVGRKVQDTSWQLLLWNATYKYRSEVVGHHSHHRRTFLGWLLSRCKGTFN